ncbi:DUF6228 family protein [Streptomyces sp. NPDC048304]|uniref:DUF6228 family protein n=1 Tax=Streptomyces sp. NPDC048304 TaxID=3154820 RepID=UPI0033D3728A
MIIRCRETPSVGVRLRDRGGVDADSVHYAVELWAPGLRKAAGGWSASVTTRVEAGEQMALLASEVRGFLSGR